MCAGATTRARTTATCALQDILPILQQAKVGGFVLPFANPRHAHEYRCLQGLPLADDQIIVAGVIDTLTNFVEHPEVVADRIEHVARAVGDPRRVMAGTDCGFDTSAGMGRVAEDVVWAKLKAMADGAKIASSRILLKKSHGRKVMRMKIMSRLRVGSSPHPRSRSTGISIITSPRRCSPPRAAPRC